jgi:DNA primase
LPSKIQFKPDFQDRIQLIKESLDLERLVEDLGFDRVELSGKEVNAACPFHDDHKQHWSINADVDSDRWGRHACWVCHEDGGKGFLTTLIRNILSLKSTEEAVDWLEQYAGIQYDEETAHELPLRRRLKGRLTGRKINVDQGPSDDLSSHLSHLVPGSEGWQYLIDRGVLPDQITSRFVQMGRGYYQDRVVFPIFDNTTKMVSFCARHIGEAEKKVLYPPGKGTISKILYGVDKVDLLESDRAYLVEGVFDVLAVERSLMRIGAPSNNVLATLGPRLYPGQIQWLKMFNEVVVIPDMKGKAQSLVPSTRELLGYTHRLSLVEVPREMDVDDLERNDAKLLDYLLQNTLSLWKTKVKILIDYTIRR